KDSALASHLDKGEKHIIPREQYRRKRRVFSSESNEGRREFAPDDSRSQAERTREFQNAPEARREASGGEHSASHTDPDQNPNQDPNPAPDEDSGRGA